MRRSIVLSTILAASLAVVSACDPKPEVPNKPAVTTPTPVAAASPTPPPTTVPTPSPVKPGASPEVKKTDDKNVNKNVKPAETPKAK